MDSSLVKLERAEQLLAEARTLDDVQAIRDIAKAAQEYARAAHLGLDAQNHAAEIRLRAERKAGEILAEMKRTGARHDGKGRKEQYQNGIVKLSDVGVTPKESAKWQSLAELPETDFRQALVQGERERLTDATLQRAVKEHRQSRKQVEKKNKLSALAESFTLETVAPTPSITIHNRDARQLSQFIEPCSVQLVVTSPPYNVGIEYREHDDAMDDLAYQEMLSHVFHECNNVLVEGGRIAIVVPFGVGRNPYKLIAPIISDLLIGNGFALRGWIVWHKLSAMGSTAWGSFRLPTNPTLRDATECIVVAHKGNESLNVPRERLAQDEKGSYSPFLQNADDFTEFVRDYWMIHPESATRVGHPAPFPVELAARLIRLYAYPAAHVLDPFMGSGTTLLAAKQLGCRATGFEIDKAYCALAQERLG